MLKGQKATPDELLDDDELEDELDDELDDELLEEDEDVEVLTQNAVPKVKSPVTSSKHPCCPKKQTGVMLLLQMTVTLAGAIILSFASQVGHVCAVPLDELEEELDELEEELDELEEPEEDVAIG